MVGYKANNATHNKTKMPCLVAFCICSFENCDTRPGNKLGLFYNAPERAHKGQIFLGNLWITWLIRTALNIT